MHRLEQTPGSRIARNLRYCPEEINPHLPYMNILRISIAAAGLSLASVAFAADAGTNWTDKCASCHGPDGHADTKMGKKLKIRSMADADFQDPSPTTRPSRP